MTSRRVTFLAIVALTVVALYWTQGGRGPGGAPLTPEALFQQGLRGVQKRDVAAIQAAREGLESVAEFRDQVALLRGAESLFAGQPAAALEEFGQLKPDGPFRDPLLTLTGEALYRLGELDDAERCLVMAIQDNPEHVDALRWLATVSYDLGEIDKTLHFLGEVCRIAPADARPHQMLGVIYRDFGEHLRAIPELGRALELTTVPEVQNEIRPQLAASQMSLKQFDAARKTLENCPDSVSVWALKADCLWQSGESKAAGEALAKAESLGELPTSARKFKARMLLDQRDLGGARQLLESAVASDSYDDEAHFLLAQVLQQQQDEAGFQSHLARSESIKSLKDTLTKLSGQAMEEPANADIRDQLAVVCDQLGQKPLAGVWRTAAASCRRRQAVAVPRPEKTP